MSFHTLRSQIPDAYASLEDEAEMPRLSRRSSLLLLIVTSALVYGLIYGMASLMWRAAVG